MNLCLVNHEESFLADAVLLEFHIQDAVLLEFHIWPSGEILSLQALQASQDPEVLCLTVPRGKSLL